MEREFLSQDIGAAVASALNPGTNFDTHAHEVLVKLATTREGLVRLVTTNFDRIFDNCRDGLKTYQPPNLPNPSRPNEIDGIIYLHGKVNTAYNGADGDGFVLSTSEFGRAYLSDGWATSFFREIIDRYFVVFVGYTADDPPVKYLLEALNKTTGRMNGVYAFQSGEASDATNRWQHKGVEAIPYEATDDHVALWDTLEAWAERAENPEAWIEHVISLARQGPEVLQPYERGQVAHLVGTSSGMQKFSSAEFLPPATWLCTFDPYRRYEKPGQVGKYDEKRPYIDPFDLYGLDSDAPPSKPDPEDHFNKRETPSDAWSALDLNKTDRLELRNKNVASLRDHWADASPRLPPRLEWLAIWISKVSEQPAAVWWAAHQKALHTEIIERVNWQLKQSTSIVPANPVQIAWLFLFEHHRHRSERAPQTWHEFARDIEKYGWNSKTIKDFARIACPFIKVERQHGGGPIPPETSAHLQVSDLIDLDVEYPDIPKAIQIPDDKINHIVQKLRQNLEISVELENEIGGYGLEYLSPIEADDDSKGDTYGRSRGLSGWVLYFVECYNKLRNLDLASALIELRRWPVADGTVFSRLRIWTLGNETLTPRGAFYETMNDLSREVFWDSHHARDLLLALSSRWNDLETRIKRLVEKRILEGPPKWKNEKRREYAARKASSILTRAHWLHERGCQLSSRSKARIEIIKRKTSDWREESARFAARSLEGRTSWIDTRTEHASLLNIPVRDILIKSKEISRVSGFGFTEHDPFTGLVENSPVRAFAALRSIAKGGEYPEWAWRKFLTSKSRENDNPRLIKFVANHILICDENVISELIHSLADWFHKAAKFLSAADQNLYSSLFHKLTSALASLPDKGDSTVIRTNRDPDWATEALNSPTGDLAQALFDDPQKNELTPDVGLPDEWRLKIERLLALPDNLKIHAIVIFSYNLSWFYWVSPSWTEKNLLNILACNDIDAKDAFWAGFLWSQHARGSGLFILLKPHMLALAKSRETGKRREIETLSGMIISAWALREKETGQRWVSDEELRDVLLKSTDEIRVQMLWHAHKWVSKDEEKNPEGQNLIYELLHQVWPRQIATKSPKISACLCNIAFSLNADDFGKITPTIIPLLTKLDEDQHIYLHDTESIKKIIDKHSDLLLSIIYAALPDKAEYWPYGIEEILNLISDSNAGLHTDGRFLELRRVWDSR